MPSHRCDIPEEKLTIKIADVDSVHVDEMDVLEPSQSKIGEYLASQTTCADDKNFALVPQEVLHLLEHLSKISCVKNSVGYSPHPLPGMMDQFEGQVCQGSGQHGNTDLANRLKSLHRSRVFPQPLRRMELSRTMFDLPAAANLNEAPTGINISLHNAKVSSRFTSMESRSSVNFSGHQYLRQRLVLSILTGKHVRIDKIRSEDKDPGLRGVFGVLQPDVS
jgi:hypothetical protein